MSAGKFIAGFIVGGAIGAIAGIIVFIVNANTTPATYADYQPLYEQVNELRSDFSAIGDMDNISSYYPEKGKLILDGGKECDLAVYFDVASNKITNTVEIDKVLTTPQYIVSLVFTAISGAGIAFLIISAVFIIIILKKARPLIKIIVNILYQFYNIVL